jgi:hypothetical protein
MSAILFSLENNTEQYSTVQYSTVKYSTVQYSTVKYSTVQCSTVKYSRFNTYNHSMLTSNVMLTKYTDRGT